MSTSDPWVLVSIIFGTLWAWAEFRGLVAGWRADVERDRLLDRIQSQTPGELERLDAHATRRAAAERKSQTPVSPRNDKTLVDMGAYEETVWTPPISAAEAHEIVRDIAG
jgi:hypothetical protein